MVIAKILLALIAPIRLVNRDLVTAGNTLYFVRHLDRSYRWFVAQESDLPRGN
jgi:hypothetical protein